MKKIIKLLLTFYIACMPAQFMTAASMLDVAKKAAGQAGRTFVGWWSQRSPLAKVLTVGCGVAATGYGLYAYSQYQKNRALPSAEPAKANPPEAAAPAGSSSSSKAYAEVASLKSDNDKMRSASARPITTDQDRQALRDDELGAAMGSKEDTEILALVRDRDRPISINKLYGYGCSVLSYGVSTFNSELVNAVLAHPDISYDTLNNALEEVQSNLEMVEMGNSISLGNLAKLKDYEKALKDKMAKLPKPAKDLLLKSRAASGSSSSASSSASSQQPVPQPTPGPDLEEQLLDAAFNGQAEVVENLVQRKVDIDMEGKLKAGTHGPPLIAAIENGHVEVVNILLKHSANVDIQYLGIPAIVCAYTHGNSAAHEQKARYAQIVKTLRNAQAIVDSTQAKAADAFVEKYLPAQPAASAASSSNSSAPTAVSGSTSVASVQQPAPQPTPTPASAVAPNAQKEQAAVSVQSLPPQPTPTPATAASMSSSSAAASSSNTLAQAKTEAQSKQAVAGAPTPSQPQTSLSISEAVKKQWFDAAQNGQSDQIEKLCQENPMIKDERDGFRDTALMSAAYHGHPSIVKILIDNKADLNLLDSKNETAIVTAYRQYHDTRKPERKPYYIEIVKMLFAANAKVEGPRCDKDKIEAFIKEHAPQPQHTRPAPIASASSASSSSTASQTVSALASTLANAAIAAALPKVNKPRI